MRKRAMNRKPRLSRLGPVQPLPIMLVPLTKTRLI